VGGRWTQRSAWSLETTDVVVCGEEVAGAAGGGITAGLQLRLAVRDGNGGRHCGRMRGGQRKVLDL